MMTSLAALWLPIVVSAVVCFVISALIHMVAPWHKFDYAPIPDESRVLDALRPFAIPPGDYMAPKPTTAGDMSSPEFIAKRMAGPVLIVTVLPNRPLDMRGSLAGWFVYLLVIITIAAMVAGAVLAPGANHRAVFHLVGVVTLVGFAGALWQMSIWYRRKISTTLKATFDGLIYALITAEIFALMWPTS